MAIVDSTDLSRWLQTTVNASTADVAIRVAEGWVRSVFTGAWPPDPVPEDLWAWAVELAAIAYDNPRGMTTRTVGNDITGYGNAARRAEILTQVANRYGTVHPVGSFPPPEPPWTPLGRRC